MLTNAAFIKGQVECDRKRSNTLDLQFKARRSVLSLFTTLFTGRPFCIY